MVMSIATFNALPAICRRSTPKGYFALVAGQWVSVEFSERLPKGRVAVS